MTRAPANKPNHCKQGALCELSMKSGVLFVHTGRESIKFGPPLTISDSALIEGLEVLEQSLEMALS